MSDNRLKTLYDNNIITINDYYAPFYDMLKDNLDVQAIDIFYVTMLLGYKNNKQRKITKENQPDVVRATETSKVTQVRTNYNNDYHPVMYALMEEISGFQFFSDYNDEKLKHNIEELNNYANGGMDLLIEEVLQDYLTESGQRNVMREKSDLVERVIQFLYDQLNNNEVPF